MDVKTDLSIHNNGITSMFTGYEIQIRTERPAGRLLSVLNQEDLVHEIKSNTKINFQWKHLMNSFRII